MWLILGVIVIGLRNMERTHKALPLGVSEWVFPEETGICVSGQGGHRPIGWGPGQNKKGRKVISSLSLFPHWSGDTLLLSLHVKTPGSLAFGLQDLGQQSLGSSGLWSQTKNYTISFPSSEAFKFGLSQSTSIQRSPACRWCVMGLSLHNCMRQFP